MAFLDENGLAELWSLITAEDDKLAAADVKIATGSYTGTGVYGSSNKNTLTFGFAPKFVFILQTTSSDSGTGALMLYGATRYSTIPDSSSGIQLHKSNNVSWSGNTVSWFNNVDQTNGWSADNCRKYQLNVSGQTYQYIAIG